MVANRLTGFVTVAATVLLIVAFASWRHGGSDLLPLTIYITGVAVVWTAILGVMWFLGDVERFRTFALICFGFAIGMLAMYIAVHIYK